MEEPRPLMNLFFPPFKVLDFYSTTSSKFLMSKMELIMFYLDILGVHSI
jgi:hypothetical protein